MPTYCSLMIIYDPLVLNYLTLKDKLVCMLKDLNSVELPEKQVIEIPVAYGGEYGPDLAEVAAAHNMTEEEVIKIHSAPEYPIYMLGFVEA